MKQGFKCLAVLGKYLAKAEPNVIFQWQVFCSLRVECVVSVHSVGLHTSGKQSIRTQRHQKSMLAHIWETGSQHAQCFELLTKKISDIVFIVAHALFIDTECHSVIPKFVSHMPE